MFLNTFHLHSRSKRRGGLNFSDKPVSLAYINYNTVDAYLALQWNKEIFRPFPPYLCSKARLLNSADPFWLRLEFFSVPPLSHHLTLSFLPLAHKEEKSIYKVNHFTHPTDPWYMLVYWQQWHPYIWALHMEHTEPCTFGQLDTGISDQETKVTKIL